MNELPNGRVAECENSLRYVRFNHVQIVYGKEMLGMTHIETSLKKPSTNKHCNLPHTKTEYTPMHFRLVIAWSFTCCS